ncbi:MAG: hypothetical protein GW808_04200 [Sphingomonadales bacterium]|nr:hypothetical protein [Sphingomonadales bacterium]PIX63785.1 MAG: hypothetical protein COZ43_13500 [Sphingomonadales bacterium CG_4_10_14_3_um_filter_58_15]NCO49135.1 hypothetical protein [Sphingomonadales bacterium]NCP00051.1 hypothetical protein [Sphingomonadales bacterium]NCP27326.1 hypothetical protein [Sphingomonadales bacterium]
MYLEKKLSPFRKIVLGYFITIAGIDLLLSAIGQINYPKYIDLWFGFLGAPFGLVQFFLNKITGSTIMSDILCVAVIALLVFVKFGNIDVRHMK